MSDRDAILAFDGVQGGIIRALTARLDNCPDRDKDPLAYHALQETWQTLPASEQTSGAKFRVVHGWHGFNICGNALTRAQKHNVKRLGAAPREARRNLSLCYTFPWQYLYFLPDPQGQGALRGVVPQVSGRAGSISSGR